MPCGPVPLGSTLEVSVRITSQCSHIAVEVWHCGILECALWSSTSGFNT